MNRASAITFAFALSVGVSSLAFAQELTSPPQAIPELVKYVPSVPDRPAIPVIDDSDAVLERTPYVPSVPTAPSEATAPSVPYVPSVPTIEAAKPVEAKIPYVPSVPAPTEIPLERQTDAITPPASTYAPTVPVLDEKVEQPTEVPAINTYKPSVPSPSAETETPAEVTTDYKPSVPAVESMATKSEKTVDMGSAAGSQEMNAALAKSYNFNPELKSFRSRLKSIDEQIPQAYAGWLPTASADYSYGYEKQTASGRELNGTHPETKSLSVVQPIFNGGETLARTSRAFNAVTIGRAQLMDAEQQTLNDAVKAYMDVVRTDEILKLSEHNENVLKEQLQATQDRFKLGETTRTDVAQSEARLARATSDKVRAAGDLDVAKANYLRVIGEAPRNVTMPSSLPAIPKTLDEAMASGLRKNPQLVAADVTRDISNDDIDILQAALLPDVSLRGTMSRQDGLSSRSGQTFDSDSLTVNAIIPIFQSGAEYSRVRQSKRTRQQRVEEFEATRDQTVESITSRWRDIETARASIISNKAAVESATVALNGVRQEADVGTRTTLDVLDAEQELFIAKVNLVTAKSREVIAVYALRAATGTLTAQDLALNVQVYDPTEHEKSVKYRVIGF